MSEPKHSINVFARNPVGTSISVGDVVIPSATEPGLFVVATSSNRGSRGSEGIALTPASGTRSTTFEIQQSGVIDAEISGLGTGSKALVRVSSAGKIERLGGAPSGSDDIIGYAEVDGRVHLHFGLPWTLIVAGSAVPGGSNGDVQINNSGAFAGRTLQATGGISLGTLSGNEIVIDGSELAPDDATYVTLGTTSGLDNERVLAVGAGLTMTDGGAGGNVTIALDAACDEPSETHQVEHWWRDAACTEAPGAPLTSVDSKRIDHELSGDVEGEQITTIAIASAASGKQATVIVDVIIAGGGVGGLVAAKLSSAFSIDDAGALTEIGTTDFVDKGTNSVSFGIQSADDNLLEINGTNMGADAAQLGVVIQVTRHDGQDVAV